MTSSTETRRGIELHDTSASQRLEALHAFRSSIMLPPIAYSSDGKVLQIESPLRDAPLVGDHVVLEQDGTRLLAQVTSGAIEVREGPQVSLSSPALEGTDAVLNLRIRVFNGSAVVLGALEAAGFRTIDESHPFEETMLTPATDDDVRAYHRWACASAKRATLDVGRAPSLPDVRVHLHAAGLSRHTLFCGQSGSGKTFSLGVLLERVLLDTTLPLVILDPNSDHVLLGTLRSREDAERVRGTRYTDAAWAEIEAGHAAVAGHVRVVHDAEAAVAARRRGDARAVVVDMGVLADARARHETAASVLQQLWDTRRDREPVLIVLDEAHDVCPAEPISDAQRHATELAIAIAGEGRKFGRHLLLATQRPQKLHPNVVSQCDNLMLLRMNSSTDVDDIAGSFSHVPAGLLHRAPTFEQGMALVGGPLVPHPTLLRVDGRITPEGGSDVPISWA
jgi:DNA helicase HerA-like ATPase